VGCCSNVFFLEKLTNPFPSSGNLITLAQFSLIAIKGFIFESRFGTKKPQIPLGKYLKLVVMFFVVSVLNNYALNFNISMPLHMIFRSGSLIANMVLGIFFLNKKYGLREYVSIVLITVGICMCTLASSKSDSFSSSSISSSAQDFVDFVWWIIGLTMLTLALLLSACMGIEQEKLYKCHGKYPGEALFYNHVLCLPGFLLLYQDISQQVGFFNGSEPLFDIGLANVVVPVIWMYLLGNVLTQYVCISSVFVLTTECSSLTVTLVLTLRKFTSLLISILYFDNPFTFWHWFGTSCVFVGTLMFTNFVKIFMHAFPSREAKIVSKKTD
jgi:UDP-xylose/UDP-N-acetylglucosamine transporter B4